MSDLNTTLCLPPLLDRFGRVHKSLRISVTDRCNIRCFYCMPTGPVSFLPREEILSYEEIVRVVRVAVGLGVRKLRITGGEPLVRAELWKLVEGLSDLEGIEEIALTTNGMLLAEQADRLKRAGLDRINISLDTLDADAFRSIARSGDLATVLMGIEDLLQAGISVKINMVPMRHVNDDQILPMLDYCMDRGIELRFIELMKMGHLLGSKAYQEQFFGMGEILDLIETRHAVAHARVPYDSTAVRFRVDEDARIGIIANETEPFCQTCSRLRLSSNGKLFGCLSNAMNYDLRPVLAIPEAFALAKLQRILGSAMADKQTTSFSGEVTVMKFIGG